MGGESAAAKGPRPLRGATGALDLAVYRRSATDEDQCSLPYGNAVTIRREHYPGVQVSIVHPDSEPPLITATKRLGTRSLQSYSKQKAPPCGGAFCLELIVGVSRRQGRLRRRVAVFDP